MMESMLADKKACPIMFQEGMPERADEAHAVGDEGTTQWVDDLTEGKRIITDGLADVKRNHATGTLLAYDASAEVWQVHLDEDDKVFMISAENLKPLIPPLDSGSDAAESRH
eukprot:gnl/TRDRNA2_/TRDRNA2_160143_c2_seq1.p1 gnl/TRDRNA2_/TRDRNA2_160143_c2~~gnl/TRDRNA2_/TRDRNA2_160143_c2_seq1.p1  ORF type:complete len:112 (-),score=23.32 gnl/TRDRNA2_/TRDRNA2_160143_c2_seq1:133-468(-)